MIDSLQLILTALGNAILNSIWQTGLLWLLVLLYARLNVSPQKLSSVSFAALLTSFVSFIITFFISILTPYINFGMLQWIDSIGSVYPIMFYAAIAYLLLLIVPTTRLLFGIRNVYILRNKGLAKVPGHLKIFLLNASQYLDIKRKVKIFTSTIISSPLTVGFIKPVILLPVAMVNQLSTHQVEAIILHELAHIKRNDYLQNILTQIILTIFYFNPFAKMLAKMQSLEREKSADKWVVQFEYNNRMYANTILQLAKQNFQDQNKLAIPISGKSSSLLERIEWLLGSAKRRYPSLKSLTLLSLFIAVAFTISLIQKVNLPTTSLENFAYNQPAATYIPTVHSTIEDIPKEEVESEIILQDQEKTAPVPENKEEVQKETIAHEESRTEENNTEVAATFVNNITVVSPELKETEENKVQEALTATKKIVTELSWKAIDNSLAETVTKEERQLLKEAYSQKLEAANWEKQADMLRLHYNNINWEKATKNLAIAIEGIKIDSVYNKYKEAAHV
ncbi:M56 family metallopeptidase [Niabella ginsengisoli]|uniref:M56 family metallopeptidase n=1 Tax=Niabella ginsengisoli TaxID=522298 RepID=A0ABS9SGB0_9BACT|nr:M56 family metallopeptidase [Niabella ginsengisoli]MCH5597401.1 M56 family metallopeptidase [Niabella ginsengisoli]